MGFPNQKRFSVITVILSCKLPHPRGFEWSGFKGLFPYFGTKATGVVHRICSYLNWVIGANLPKHSDPDWFPSDILPEGADFPNRKGSRTSNGRAWSPVLFDWGSRHRPIGILGPLQCRSVLFHLWVGCSVLWSRLGLTVVPYCRVSPTDVVRVELLFSIWLIVDLDYSLHEPYWARQRCVNTSSVGSLPSSAAPELGLLLFYRDLSTQSVRDALRKSSPPWM